MPRDYTTSISTYNEYIERLKKRHPDKFRETTAEKFRPYFGQRIEVRTSYGTTMRGWVSGTTGWNPSLMLLKRRDSTGSHQLISDKDTLVRVIDRGPR